MVDGADVGLRKVADGNEIANTGAIRRIIVVSEDLHSRPLSGRRLAGYLDEVGRVGGDLPGPAERVGAGHVEVSQDDVAKAVRAVDVAQHPFDHQFGGAIGTGRSEEHTSELQSLMRISYAVFCLKKKTNT